MNLVRKDIVVKSIAVFLLIVLTAALETSMLSRLRLLGTTPELLLFIVAAVAVYEGPTAGVFCGFFAGILLDGLGAKSLWWYTVASVFAAVLIGVYSPLLFRRRVFTAMLWGALFWFLCEFIRFFAVFYLFSESNLTPVFTVIVPQTLYSCLLSPLVIAPVAWLHKKFSQEPRLFR